MTRSEYIDILTHRLQGIDDASLQDIILEIEDHIDGLEREHPEKSSEEIVQSLESPESLADSLREAANLGPYIEPQDKGPRTERTDKDQRSHNTAEEGVASDSGSAHEGNTKTSTDANTSGKKMHITIDDIELHEALKKAFDIAKIFSRRQREGDGESFGNMFANAFNLGDMKFSNVRRVSLRTRSTDVEVLFSNDRLSVATPGEEKPHLRVDYSSEGALKISMPLGVPEPDRVELRVPASIDDLEISTMAGDVRVLDRVGPLAVSTASGDIQIEACDGDLLAKSASGDISVRECREDLKISTASGDIEILADELCNSIEAASASGNISLRYSEDWDARVSVSTVSGDVDHDAVQAGHGSICIGKGLVPVRLSTVSGDIVIRKE